MQLTMDTSVFEDERLLDLAKRVDTSIYEIVGMFAKLHTECQQRKVDSLSSRDFARMLLDPELLVELGLATRAHPDLLEIEYSLDRTHFPSTLKAAAKADPVTRATWEAYGKAFAKRYRTAPVRNATVSGMIAKFINRVGIEEAPEIAAYYVTHNDQFYVRNLHAVRFLLQDAEKLRTEWVTGQQMTSGEAKITERRQGNVNAFKKLMVNNG